MTVVEDIDLDAALSATWPAASTERRGDWMVRTSDGGGKRVTAATWAGPGMAEPPPLVRVRENESAVDAHLDGLGYEVVDATLLRMAASESIAKRPAPAEMLPSWPPLAAAVRLWARAGIGPERQAVMARAPEPKAAALGRVGDAPLGVAFVAVSGGVAFVHAVEVAPDARRQGVARRLMTGLAHWAAERGAAWIAVAVTEANTGANALYEGLGMPVVGRYHYRVRP